MAFEQDLRRVRAIVWKDLTSERRSKAGFNSVAFLGVLILLLFGFALGPDTEALRNAAAVRDNVVKPTPRRSVRGCVDLLFGPPQVLGVRLTATCGRVVQRVRA